MCREKEERGMGKLSWRYLMCWFVICWLGVFDSLVVVFVCIEDRCDVCIKDMFYVCGDVWFVWYVCIVFLCICFVCLVVGLLLLLVGELGVWLGYYIC